MREELKPAAFRTLAPEDLRVSITGRHVKGPFMLANLVTLWRERDFCIPHDWLNEKLAPRLECPERQTPCSCAISSPMIPDAALSIHQHQASSQYLDLRYPST